MKPFKQIFAAVLTQSQLIFESCLHNFGYHETHIACLTPGGALDPCLGIGVPLGVSNPDPV